jgi:hypothetical protein
MLAKTDSLVNLRGRYRLHSPYQMQKGTREATWQFGPLVAQEDTEKTGLQCRGSWRRSGEGLVQLKKMYASLRLRLGMATAGQLLSISSQGVLLYIRIGKAFSHSRCHELYNFEAKRTPPWLNSEPDCSSCWQVQQTLIRICQKLYLFTGVPSSFPEPLPAPRQRSLPRKHANLLVDGYQQTLIRICQMICLLFKVVQREESLNLEPMAASLLDRLRARRRPLALCCTSGLGH